MASNERLSDVPPPYTALSMRELRHQIVQQTMQQPLQQSTMQVTDAPPPYTDVSLQKPVNQPREPRMPAIPVTDAPPPYTIVPLQQPLQQHLQRPMATQQLRLMANTPVPRELLLNADEARRVIQSNVTSHNNVIRLYPNGEHLHYPRSRVAITCQFCHSRVLTKVEASVNGLDICIIVLIMTFCFPVGLFYNFTHTWPQCKKEVGSWRQHVQHSN